MSDTFDLLIQSCAQSQKWPSNLLRPRILRSLFESHCLRLQEDKNKLFLKHNDRSKVDVWEAPTGERCFRQSQWNCLEDIKEHMGNHLLHKEKDPHIRHVFLSANNSSAPLDCTYDIFLYLCTFHQVPSEFANLLCSFGLYNGVQRDFHHTHLFQQIDRKDSSRLEIQTLGRSGLETRVGFTLSAMELEIRKTESGKTERLWKMRQAVTYHSLDLSTGRSFWLTTKANDLIFKRVKEASTDAHGSVASIPLTPQAALSNAMQTHLIITDWCSEGWRWYISSLELEIRSIFDKIANAPIPPEDTTLDPILGLVKSLSNPISDTFEPRQNSQPGSTWTRDTRGRSGHDKGTPAFSNMTDLAQSATDVPMQRLLGRETSRERQVEHTMESIEILKEFSLNEMQELNFTSSKLREARMVMGLNISILKELKEYYLGLFGTVNLPEDVKEECAIDLLEFKNRVTSTERFIASECLRCDTLMNQLEDGRSMYGLILEARSREREKLFAMNSHDSTQRMEDQSRRMEAVTDSMHDIALATEQDTSSMHIITFFTLIFLPGTFLATFFSTPIFGDGSNTTFDNNLFYIFLEVCVPLMVVTLVAWAAYTRYKKTRRNRLEQQRLRRSQQFC